MGGGEEEEGEEAEVAQRVYRATVRGWGGGCVGGG
jgi:hypothetical protein